MTLVAIVTGAAAVPVMPAWRCGAVAYALRCEIAICLLWLVVALVGFMVHCVVAPDSRAFM